MLMLCLVLVGLLLLSACDMVTKDLMDYDYDSLLDTVNNNQKDFLIRKRAFDRIKQMSDLDEEAKLALKQIEGGLKKMFTERPERSQLLINTEGQMSTDINKDDCTSDISRSSKTRVFILSGQSNCAGAGNGELLPAEYQKTDSGAMIFANWTRGNGHR